MENRDEFLSKIKNAVRKKTGRLYNEFDFEFFEKGNFAFKFKFENWGVATVMRDYSFHDNQPESDFEDSINAICQHMEWNSKKYNFLKIDKRSINMGRRKLMRKALMYQQLNKRYGR